MITRQLQFSYNEFDEEGYVPVQITRTLVNGGAEFLPRILSEFKQFLHGLGFSYVDALVARDSVYYDDGDPIEHSSEDVE